MIKITAQPWFLFELFLTIDLLFPNYYYNKPSCIVVHIYFHHTITITCISTLIMDAFITPYITMLV